MDTGSVNSIPASMANSSARSTPVPNNYKALTPSSAVLALGNMPDEDLRRRAPDDLISMMRRLENEYRGMISEHGAIMKDVNKKMQIFLLEIRGLKDINQNLQDDNQELRDLCCFLDDDRQRGRKLAREWQRFGRYTASVMRSEVSAYQEKLKELEQKQEELIVDNLELKELCLFLDQERLRIGQTRDEGDGSSSSTVAGGDEPPSDDIELLPVSQLNNGSNTRNTSANSDYVQHLEEQIRNLEEEKRAITQDLDMKKNKYTVPPGNKVQPQSSGPQRLGPDGNQSRDSGVGTSPAKPEAVVHAMKVLEVHENLERPHTSVGEENLDDKEKAIVREMCNVVWRKLGNVSAEQHGSGSSTPQYPVYENVQPGAERSAQNDLRNGPSFGGHTQMHQSYPPHSHPNHFSQQGSRSNTDLGQQYGHQARAHMDPGGIGGIYTAQPVSQAQRSHSSQGYPSQSSHFNHQGQGQGQTGRSHQVPSSQRPPQSSYQANVQAPPPPPAQYYSSQQAPYSYVRTSHSTPVTPTPLQRSHSPVSKPHGMSNSNMRPEPRSHSPGPNRGPNCRLEPQMSSGGPQNSTQHLYQNHPRSKGDHSYENIQYGYNPTSSQNYPADGRSMQMASGNRNEHPPPPHIDSQYNQSDISAPNPGYVSRGHQPSSSHDHHHGNYQNVQVGQPIPMKQLRRDPSPQGYNLRQGSSMAPHPQGSFRSSSNTPTYSQQYPPPATPQVGRRPAQPQYNREGYPEPQSNKQYTDRADRQQYPDRADKRGRSNQYN